MLNLYLPNSPYQKIKRGEKKIELRLNKPKFSNLTLEETLQFVNKESNNTFQAQVDGILYYPRFRELIEDIGMEQLGYSKHHSIEKLVSSMYTIYTKQQEEELGILGIKLKLIP